MTYTTREVARLVPCTVWQLTNMLRTDRVPQPAKGTDGRLRWSGEDVTLVRQILQARARAREENHA